jgi:hypothetical protein
MLNIELDRESAIAVLEPSGELTEHDFDVVGSVIDPYIKEHGKLNGIIINTKEFPGWDSFGAMLKHIKFIKEHEQKLSHIAIVTDSTIAGLAESIAAHFITAKIKHFPFSKFTEAESWILAIEHE